MSEQCQQYLNTKDSFDPITRTEGFEQLTRIFRKLTAKIFYVGETITSEFNSAKQFL